MDQRVKQLENSSHQGNEEETLIQNPSNEESDEIVNPTADMIQEPSSETFLQTISRINF